jgi:FKBP-type peptidyl-prolyl cis-trans isomerase SlyD
MIVSENNVISLSYILRLSTGVIADQADANDPLAYIHGTGMLLPDFEAQLHEKPLGHKFDFTLTPESGYGEHYEENIAEFPKSMFLEAGFPEDQIVKGNFVPMNDAEGNNLQGKLIEITEETVKMDFNHPLAGETLHFVGEVIGVRPATEDELAHGHVHGEGGHHH